MTLSSDDSLADNDEDGMPDVYEIWHGGCPTNALDAADLVLVFTASENSGTNLAAALAASVKYSIVEVEPGEEALVEFVPETADAAGS